MNTAALPFLQVTVLFHPGINDEDGIPEGMTARSVAFLVTFSLLVDLFVGGICNIAYATQLSTAAPCDPVLPHFPEEGFILGVIYGGVLWADINAATRRGRGVALAFVQVRYAARGAGGHVGG